MLQKYFWSFLIFETLLFASYAKGLTWETSDIDINRFHFSVVPRGHIFIKDLWGKNRSNGFADKRITITTEGMLKSMFRFLNAWIGASIPEQSVPTVNFRRIVPVLVFCAFSGS